MLRQLPLQVLDIVYFSTTTTPGGFFPDGVAGMNQLRLLLDHVHECFHHTLCMCLQATLPWPAPRQLQLRKDVQAEADLILFL